MNLKRFFSLDWLFHTDEICNNIKRTEDALHELCLKSAKERGGSVVVFDIADLTVNECDVLLSAIGSGRLRIKVDKS